MNIVAASPSVSLFNTLSPAPASSVPYARLTLPQDQFGAEKKEKHQLPRRVQTELRMDEVAKYLDELRQYPETSRNRMAGVFETLTGRFPAWHIIQAIGHSRRNPLNLNPDPYISDFVDFAIQAFEDRKSTDKKVVYNSYQRLNEYNAAQLKLFREMGRDDLVEALFKYDKKKQAPYMEPNGNIIWNLMDA